jgi:hypothetical protein
MAIRERSGPARLFGLAGAASIVVATVVSIATDEDVKWAWGAMVLTTLLGLALLATAATVELNRRLRRKRAPAA